MKKRKPKKPAKDLCFLCDGTYAKHEPDCPQRKDAK